MVCLEGGNWADRGIYREVKGFKDSMKRRITQFFWAIFQVPRGT